MPIFLHFTAGAILVKDGSADDALPWTMAIFQAALPDVIVRHILMGSILSYFS